MLKTALAGAIIALAAVATAPQTADAQGWHRDRDWRGHDRGYHRDIPPRCVAQAHRLGGSGPAVPGISGIGYGRGACSEAMHECRRELRHLQRTGRAPFATCEIVGRW